MHLNLTPAEAIQRLYRNADILETVATWLEPESAGLPSLLRLIAEDISDCTAVIKAQQDGGAACQ